MYLNSDSIHVFPLAKNRTTDRAGRMFYEDNIANIIRQLADKHSFIITKQPKLTHQQKGNQGSTVYDIVCESGLEFTLFGYFVRIAADSVLFSFDANENSSIDLYAVLNYDDVAKEVNGQDVKVDDVFHYEGISIRSTKPEDSDRYLKLCTVTNSIENSTRVFKIIVDNDSYLKFDKESVPNLKILRIDGKRA